MQRRTRERCSSRLLMMHLSLRQEDNAFLQMLQRKRFGAPVLGASLCATAGGVDTRSRSQDCALKKNESLGQAVRGHAVCPFSTLLSCSSGSSAKCEDSQHFILASSFKAEEERTLQVANLQEEQPISRHLVKHPGHIPPHEFQAQHSSC
jgi:hypothetical protein